MRVGTILFIVVVTRLLTRVGTMSLRDGTMMMRVGIVVYMRYGTIESGDIFIDERLESGDMVINEIETWSFMRVGT